MPKKGRERVDKRNPAHQSYEDRRKKSKPKVEAGDTNNPNDPSNGHIQGARIQGMWLDEAQQMERQFKRLQESLRSDHANQTFRFTSTTISTNTSANTGPTTEDLRRLEELAQQRRDIKLAEYHLHDAFKGSDAQFMAMSYRDPSDPHIYGEISCDFCGDRFQMTVHYRDALEVRNPAPARMLYCSDACYADARASAKAGEDYVLRSLGVDQ